MWEEFWRAISCQACLDDLDNQEEDYPMLLKDLNKDQSFYRIDNQVRMSESNYSKNLKFQKDSAMNNHNDTDRYNKFSNFLDNSHGPNNLDFGKVSGMRPSHWTSDLNLSLSRIDDNKEVFENADVSDIRFSNDPFTYSNIHKYNLARDSGFLYRKE